MKGKIGGVRMDDDFKKEVDNLQQKLKSGENNKKMVELIEQLVLEDKKKKWGEEDEENDE